MTTSQSKTLVLKNDHVNSALTTYLQSLSFINDNQEVTKYKKVPEGIEVQIKGITNDD